MVEVSKEEEIELDLGLSIGGASFRRTVKPRLEEGGDTTPPATNEYQMVTVNATVVDPQAKREMQALRRQEAKRKREEKRTRVLTGEQPPAKKNGSLTENDHVSGHYPAPAPVQFLPYSNGYAYPCVVPCWANGAGAGGGNGCNSEQNGKTASLDNGSPIRSCSTVSEHHNAASHEGGSCDTRSHSSPLNGSIEKNTVSQTEHTATSHSIESNHSLLIQPKEEPVSNEEPPKEPTKPEIESGKGSGMKTNPAMPQMPYVSTTGNGPNGKTVHGFLYRYSKAEISIVCVCHGSTFSPVEFVQHAGGIDISNPLKHITVTPSAFE